jgi:hypothetical protein
MPAEADVPLPSNIFKSSGTVITNIILSREGVTLDGVLDGR